MKSSTKTNVFSAVVLTCVFLISMTTGCKRTEEETAPPESGAPQQASESSANWPIFRGGPNLAGVAEGTLPEELDFLWKFETEGRIKSSPVIVDNVVYCGSTDKNVYAIDINTGKEKWFYETDTAVEAPPCVVDGTVYVSSARGILYAIDAADGSFQWQYETLGDVLGSANWTLSPDGEDIWILVGSYDNFLHCVDSKTGELIWKYQADNYINGTPAVEDGITVFGGCDAMIHVVSLADGTSDKQIDAEVYIAASAAIVDRQVYVGNYENVFIKADIETGEILWRYEESMDAFFSSPAVGENVVVVGSRDELIHCIARNDGEQVWTFQTLDQVDSSPVICDNKVIVGSMDGRLYMINLEDGDLLWSYEIGQVITSSPAVAGGMVVIGSDDGYIYAFGSKQ